MVFGPVVQYRALLRDGKAHWIWRRDLATVMDRLSARIKNYLPSSIARAPAPVDVIPIHEQVFIEQAHRIQEVVKHPAATGIAIVARPEELPVSEAIDAVTTLAREWRNAAIAAVLSIIESMTPPKMWPRLFASCGIMRCVVSRADSFTVLASRADISQLPSHHDH